MGILPMQIAGLNKDRLACQITDEPLPILQPN